MEQSLWGRERESQITFSLTHRRKLVSKRAREGETSMSHSHLVGGGGGLPKLGLGLLSFACGGGGGRLLVGGGGGGAVRGIVLVGTLLGGFGLGDRGNPPELLCPPKPDPDSDDVSPVVREGGWGGGPPRPPRDDVSDEFDVLRPPAKGAGGVGGKERSGGGGPGRDTPEEGVPPLKDEDPPREGGGGGAFPLTGGGGPERVGGAGGGFGLNPPGAGREGGGAAGRDTGACLTAGME